MTTTLERGEGVIPHPLIPRQRIPEPVCIGPTWKRDADGAFILPPLSLAWQIFKWVEDNLLADEVDAEGKPQPFRLTNEQKRFLLWFYAVDERGRFVYRNAVLQRLKGWGLPNWQGPPRRRHRRRRVPRPVPRGWLGDARHARTRPRPPR